MTTAHGDRGADARLVEIEVADQPGAWVAAGFTVEGDRVRIGATTVRLTGDPTDPRRGIQAWTLSGLDLDGDDLDGLPTRVVDTPGTDSPGTDSPGARPSTDTGSEMAGHPATDPGSGRAPDHPNGVVGLDHVVVLTPDLERTIAALGATGLGLRRIRETTSYGSPMRQAFFRLGPTILEVVSGDTGSGAPAAEAPATWFGLAVDVDDLDRTAALLGDGLGAVKVAVQDGRRIATLRHKALGMTVAVAAMDDHADRADRADHADRIASADRSEPSDPAADPATDTATTATTADTADPPDPIPAGDR